MRMSIMREKVNKFDRKQFKNLPNRFWNGRGL